MNLGRGAALAAGGVFVCAMSWAGQSVSSRSAWDRVYSDVQADRGERAYGQTCSHCHGLSLEGDGSREIPTLVSDQFLRRWRRKSVQALFDSLMRSMPADDRGSLTPPAAANLIAYLLRANGAPAGDVPLSSERDVLAGLVLDKP